MAYENFGWEDAPDSYRPGQAAPSGSEAAELTADRMEAFGASVYGQAVDGARRPTSITSLRGTNKKLAGALMFPKVGDTLAVYWGTGFDAAFIDQQVHALHLVGANAVKVCCDTSGVNVADTTTLDQFIANLRTVLGKLSAFECVHVLVTSNPPYPDDDGSRATLEQEVAACEAICAAGDEYDNVWLFDLWNEMNEWQPGRGGPGSSGSSQPDATSKAAAAAMINAARANTSKPVTISLYAESLAQLTANTASDWASFLAQYIDVWDIHPYKTPQSSNFGVSDFAAFHALYPDMDIVLGEVSAINEDANSADANARMVAMNDLARLRYVTGVFWFTLNDYSSPGGTGTGLVGQDMTTLRTNLTDPFALLPQALPWPAITSGDGPGSGTSTPDVAEGDSGTLSGGVTLESGSSGFGNRAVFASSGDRITFSNNFLPAGTDEFTVEFKFKRARTGAENVVAQWANGTVQDANWVFAFTAGNKPCVSWIDGSGTFAELDATTATITDTDEHWGSISYDGTTMRLFIDGEGVAGVVATRQSSKNSQSITIGGVVDDATGFRGSIDELRISNTARYTGFSYTTPSAPFTVDGDTVRLVHLDTTSGS